ncbi:YfjI family protein [Sphingomonas sanxanigenens]|uniref:DUF3987 domain-containing protein n=1 Tax=Sphingomonas sanxanigenens DSM 19645 = NX02 TaxID=1123269 RepID=W0ANM1_9SPHN|nr:YfjI family protein [Sphingomonas sanxanigenens]AHE57325.1 hypothetical protein NX02_28740 [Sphingomonas sanxanigenens DSM 19645 = NX02]
MARAAATALDFADVGDDDAIRASIGAASSERWPNPKPLPSGLPAVKAFDIAMLPAPLAPWVEDIAERMQAPIEFVAIPAIVAAGSVIGRKVGIRPQEHTDWYEVPNLWGCIVGRPGVMKSPAVQQALRPLKRLESDARRAFDIRKVEYDAGELEREMRAEAQKGEMKRRLRANTNADLSDLAGGDEEAPKLRRYSVNDTSYQVLGELLIENPNGLLVYRDELLSLLRNLDREENVEARSFYLTAWNGTEEYTFDRIIRGKNLRVPSVTASMVGSTQPGRLRDYASSAIRGGGGDDGMMQRFSMIVWPDIAPNWKEVDREPDAVHRNAAFAVFDRLDKMTVDGVGAMHDPFDDSRPYLRFDRDGRDLFREWRRDHEKRVRGGDLHPAVESHLAKYRKLIPALALIHHLASGLTGPVGELSVLSALAWGEFLESHAHRVYSAALDRSASGAREIVRRLRRGDLDQRFTARDVQRKGWSGLTDKLEVGDVLDLLEETRWLRAIEVPTTSSGGRPTTTYIANPKGLDR